MTKLYRKGMWRIVRATRNSVYTILIPYCDCEHVIGLKARSWPLLHPLSLAGKKKEKHP